MGNDTSYPSSPNSFPPPALSSPTLPAVAKYITSGRAKRILVLAGAGISTSAGIPDFRSPGTGLYANLARLNLPYAEAVFDLGYFRKDPVPFWTLARELFYPEEEEEDEDEEADATASTSLPTRDPTSTTRPTNPKPKTRFRPTLTHSFLHLLSRKNLLSQVITQNIDGLERAAGVPEPLLVEAHGTFATQRCIECKAAQSAAEMHAALRRGAIPRCSSPSPSSPSPPDAPPCGGLVKPDITFFGEGLPGGFFAARERVRDADLALVMGTSLTVYPFASLPGLVGRDVPRVLINRDRVGDFGAVRDDVLVLGECDDGVRRLCRECGWEEELLAVWAETEGMGGKGETTEREGERERELSPDERLEREIGELTREVERTLDLSRGLTERVLREGDVDGKRGDTSGRSPVSSSPPPPPPPSHDNLDHVFLGRSRTSPDGTQREPSG
jgi:NAD-dependent histone deacetylase SIR2